MPGTDCPIGSVSVFAISVLTVRHDDKLGKSGIWTTNLSATDTVAPLWLLGCAPANPRGHECRRKDGNVHHEQSNPQPALSLIVWRWYLHYLPLQLPAWRFPLLSDSPRAVSCEVIIDDDDDDDNTDGSKATSWLGGRNRAARIINLYIDFPADEKRHVDASAASHGDWSRALTGWQRKEAARRLAAAAVPVNSHILFSLPGSERVSFPRLAREGVWHGNRLGSEVTRCCLFGMERRQTFLRQLDQLDWLHCDWLQPQWGLNRWRVHNYYKLAVCLSDHKEKNISFCWVHKIQIHTCIFLITFESQAFFSSFYSPVMKSWSFSCID